jgi:low molecular weight protein-tyrosine phosphatase
MSGRDRVFEVVFVCTGNRARSALAEALFRHYADGIPTAVSSVGTQDVGSAPPLSDAIEAGRRLGVDLTGHRSRALRHTDLSSADLVLGFEQSHVSAAVVDGEANPARAFLLGELVMLLGTVAPEHEPSAHARSAVADADLRRARYRPDRTAVVVRDPLGRSSRVMRRTAEEIDRLVRQLVLGLFGAQDVPPPQRLRSR